MSVSVQGKVAIVTGAAQGVGLAIARALHDAGARVMFADMDEARLTVETAALTNGQDHSARRFAANLGDRLALANLLSATIDAFDRVDILVNAHRLLKHGDPLESDPEQIEEMLRHNMMSALRLSQIVARRMIRQAQDDGNTAETGAIINVTTLAGTRPVPQLLGYSIACAALDQTTRALALALAPHRIRVNGISYSSLMTPEMKAALRQDPALRDRIIKGTPLGRIASADELVDTALLLASPASGFVTGQILTVDGGRGLADPVTAQSLYPFSG
ncbi:MAG: SDR family oxidoreductase [Paracoccus sp. (in: a-proteobacteria)]|uniref:SDR family NAD(P)-dependent oxidoreductase n=1 Tax=Paracoccus sp. TaxID=267 RepID=UPI0026DFDDD1|nr:SDR family oxidoreductase [Paracoccus sp. (in: a-proteobacteria)]MDO5630979.1 SDR family oxidoreductase [Paracoccus sp. (in: a-proteobacteria)]